MLALCILIVSAASIWVDPSTVSSVETVAEWIEMDFEWKSLSAREHAISSGEFIPHNNIMTGLKVCGPSFAARCVEEMVFATIPRWKTGVPATLGLLVRNTSGAHVLRPWPSLDSQVPGDCSKIQYVQSMEIDSEAVMWVVDVGRKYFNDKTAYDNSCPPKMVLIDVLTGHIVDTYVFPNEVAPYTGSFLNDIVIDVPNQIGYISSTGNNGTDLGAIVVYDRKARKSRRFEDATTHLDAKAVVSIHGIPFGPGGPTDGIALHPNRADLYFSPLGAPDLYSVSTEALRNFSMTSKDIARTVVDHGHKPSGRDRKSVV